MLQEHEELCAQGRDAPHVALQCPEGEAPLGEEAVAGRQRGVEILEGVALQGERPLQGAEAELEAGEEALAEVRERGDRVLRGEVREGLRVGGEVEGGDRVEVAVRMRHVGPAERAAHGAERDALRQEAPRLDVVAEAVDLLAHIVARRPGGGVVLLHREVLRGGVAHQERERQDDLRVLPRLRAAELARELERARRDVRERLALAARADEEVAAHLLVPPPPQEAVVRQRHAERLEALRARDDVAAVAVARAREALLHERGGERPPVRLVDDLARRPLADRQVEFVVDRPQLVDVRVFHELVAAHERAQVREQHLAARVAERVEGGPPLLEARARQRRAAVVERGRRALAHDGVDLAREVHVQRLDERLRGVVGEFRAREERLEERVDLGHAHRGVRLGDAPQLDLLHQQLQLGDEALQRDAARQAEQLDLVVAVVFVLAQEVRLVPLEDAHELVEPGAERGEVVLRLLAEPVEARVGEEVDAARAVVVADVGGDALAARGEGGGHLAPGPRERLHAPLLPSPAEMFERLFVAFHHHHVAACEPQRPRQPVVRRREPAARHVALGDFQLAAHHVRAQDAVHHRLAATGGRKAAEVPQLPLQERQRRHGVVPRGDGHHVARSPVVPQVPLRDDEDGGVRVEVQPHPLLEHKRVVAHVVGVKQAAAPHRARHDGGGAARRTVQNPPEPLFHRRFHASSSSSW